MYAGKTTAAKYCSKLLQLPFLDSDKEIEQFENMKIQSIFEKKGETYFRKQEHKWIKTTLFSNEIISTGGGLPCFNDNINILKNIGSVIFLDTPFEEIKSRMISAPSTNRPLTKSVFLFEALYHKRLEYYSKAHFSVRNKEELLQLIKKI